MAYRIVYSPEVRMHLRELSSGQRNIVLGNVLIQLSHQPAFRTKRRKPLLPNQFNWTWELRIPPFRVFYDVEEEPEQVVYIHAVGIKEGNQVRISGEIVDL